MLLTTLLGAAALPATGPWRVEATQDQCQLSRDYGAGKTALNILFRPVFSDQIGDMFIRTQRRVLLHYYGHASLEGKPGKTHRGPYVAQKSVSGETLYTRIRLDHVEFEELAHSQTLRILAKPTFETIAFDGFAKDVADLKECDRKLLDSWGIDRVTLATGNTPLPKNPIAGYFTAKDYPKEAAQGSQVGRVVAVLKIDRTGKVEDCRLAVQPGKALGEATCAQARLIPFDPGRTATGQPAPSIFVLRVQWSMTS